MMANNNAVPPTYHPAKHPFDSAQDLENRRHYNEKDMVNKDGILHGDLFDRSGHFSHAGRYFKSYFERVPFSAQVSRGVFRVRNLMQTSTPGQFSGGPTKRLFTAVLLGVLCVLGFSFLLPARSRPPKVFPPTYLTWHHVPPSHLYPLPIHSTLDERLAAWRNAPGLWWEPADFVAWNLQTCSDVIPNHNKDLIAKASLIWGVMNSTAVLTHREKMVRYIEEMRDGGAFEDKHVADGGRGYVGKGRGMVFTAGNADTLQRVLYTLKLVRKYYSSELPAAVFHFASERPADEDPIREQLKEFGAKLVEINRTKDTGRRKNYHLKAQAIVEAEWAEVLYLDSDNFPTQAPEFYFEQPNYKRLGAMFWVDYWKTSANNPIWHIIGVQCRDEWEQEAGQIVIDKRRHLDAMLLAQYMLINWEFWYYFSDGDKDVFRFSFLALRKRWALPGRYVGAAGLPSGTASGDFCSHTMQQFDHAGRPAFVHYNLLKQIPSGVGRGFSWGRTKQVMAYPTPSLRPITKDEFLSAGLNHTEKWWEEDSRSYQQRERYRLYPYPDAERPGAVRGANDVEADMLANAKDDGWAIQPATSEVRRRAAVERGVRPYFHGGVISALCIDLNWEDPQKEHREANTIGQPPDKTAPNELGIDWGYSPLEVVQWTADDLLRDMEQRVYDEGFVPSAVGF